MMLELWQALCDPAAPFLRYALLAGLIGSVAFGVVGTFVVTRRIVSLAGAIAHSVLGGVGAALYLSNVCSWSWCTPTLGALLAALISAVLIWYVSTFARQREDAVIGAIWALGMALGLLFMAKTPGYVDLQGYLFGNILLLSGRELWLMSVLDIVVVTPALLFYAQLLAVCFDGAFAELRGIKVKLINLLLLLMTALTIVLMVNVVGILLVIALLSLPAATVGQYARHWFSMMCAAIGLNMLVTTGGLLVSYQWNLPSGPAIVLLAGTIYLAALLHGAWRKRRKSGKRISIYLA